MSKTIQTLTLALIALSLSACATSQAGNKEIRDSRVTVISPPPEIEFAPAIDVPYSDVIKDVENHVGVNVRWGGQVIAAEENQGTATLTLIASPLDSRGRPQRDADGEFESGRFIVKAYGYDISEGSRFITVYGAISDKKVLTNGNLEKTIPIVTAIETVHWEENTNQYVRKSEHYGSGYPYYSLGGGYSHKRGYSSYGYSYNRGYYGGYNRGYFGGHSRFGLNVFRGKNFRSGFRGGFRSGFRGGFRSGFGRNRFRRGH